MTERFDLRYPFVNEEGVEVDCLELRRPTVGDLELMEEEGSRGAFFRSKKLVELAAGMTPREVSLLDVVDWDRVNARLMDFFPSDPEPSDNKTSES